MVSDTRGNRCFQIRCSSQVVVGGSRFVKRQGPIGKNLGRVAREIHPKSKSQRNIVKFINLPVDVDIAETVTMLTNFSVSEWIPGNLYCHMTNLVG